jgi:4Fe-4S ferredoxin
MIEKEAILDKKLRLVQRVSEEVRELIYDYKHCNGCGMCVYACPVNAIELATIHDIALGLDMPPVIIDHLKCAFCGICYSLCPFNAYEFYVNGKRIEKDSLPVSPITYVQKLESCVECAICYKVCPTNAIARNVKISREDIEVRNVGITGKILIDRKKCNFCGICGEFCEVFKLIEKDVNPDDIVPYEELLIDETKCDYCKLCEEICPERAIEVDGKRIDFELGRIAEISIEQKLCSYCSYCEKACPYNAIKTIKPMDGELILYKARFYRCDPIGCKACVKICKHNRVWWISDGLQFNANFCIYCGACENACPYDLIEVKRSCYYTKELLNAPWREAWENAVKRITSKQRIKIERMFLRKDKAPAITITEVMEEELEMKKPLKLEDRFKAVEQALKIPLYRRALETGDVEKFLKAVKKHEEQERKT